MAGTSAGGRKRWAGKTEAERREATRAANEASAREGRERRIAGLIATAPPLTAAQKARLAALIDAVPEVGDAANPTSGTQEGAAA